MSMNPELHENIARRRKKDLQLGQYPMGPTIVFLFGHNIFHGMMTPIDRVSMSYLSIWKKPGLAMKIKPK